METIPVITAEKATSQEGTLGVLSSETNDTQVKDLKISKLRESLAHLSEAASEIFQDIKQIGGFQLKQIQLQVEISAEGGFVLVGTAKAGAKGAISLTFQNKE